MGRINSSVGLITGVPIEDTVNQLIALQALPRDRLVGRTEGLQKHQQAVSDLTARLLSVQFAVRRLNQSTLFGTRNIQSQNSSLLTATATGSPAEGSYSYIPVQLAQVQQFAGDGFAARDAELNAGQLAFRRGRALDSGTELDSLNGGLGVQRGQIRISDRSGRSADIDLRFARTIDDVVQAINGANGISVNLEIHGDRLRLQDTSGSREFNLRVQDIGLGGTAEDLGLGNIDTAADTADGEDILKLHSRLTLDLLNDGRGVRLNQVLSDFQVAFRDGSEALEIDFGRKTGEASHPSAELITFRDDAELRVSAKAPGTKYNDVKVRFVDDESIVVGEESVSYDAASKLLEFRIDAGKTTADHIVSALEANSEVSELFEIKNVGPPFTTGETTSINPAARLRFTAREGGLALNNLRVEFVDDPLVVQGRETVELQEASADGGEAVLRFRISAGRTRASDIVAALERDEIAGELIQAEVLAEPFYAVATTKAAAGTNAQITLRAAKPDSEAAGVTIRFESGTGLEPSEFDDDQKVLTVYINSGETTANDVIRKINSDPVANRLFVALRASGGNGNGVVSVGDVAVTSSRNELIDTQDTAVLVSTPSGTISTLDGGTLKGGADAKRTVELTLGDVLKTINSADPDRLRAQISADGDRLELIDLTEGAGDFTVSSLNGSHALADLGLDAASSGGKLTGKRLFGGLNTVLLGSLNGGRGLGELGRLRLTDRAGTTATVDLGGATTLQDILDRINSAPLALRAELNSARTGLLLRDESGANDGQIIVQSADRNIDTADKLGLAGSVDSQELYGRDLKLQILAESTLLDDFIDGRGIGRGQFSITNSKGEFDFVDLRPEEVQTVGDVLAAVNGLDINVEARINDSGDGILLIDKAQGKETLTVEDFIGSSASELRLIGEGTETTIDNRTRQAINGTHTFSVHFEEGTTLDVLAASINRHNAGLKASVVESGSSRAPFRLVLESEEGGQFGSFLVDSSQLGFRLRETAKGQDALLLAVSTGDPSRDGELLRSSTNVFENALEEAAVTIHGTSTDVVSFTVEQDRDDVIDAVAIWADNYNKVRDKIKEYTRFNEKDVRQSGVLFGTSEALRIDVELTNLFQQRHFVPDSQFSYFHQLGITVNADGKLDLDEELLRAAVKNDSQGVLDFFTRENTGVAAKFDHAIERLVGVNGSVLVSRGQTLDRQIVDNFERIEELNRRLEEQRVKLLNDFYRMEIAIARLQDNLFALESFTPVPPLQTLQSN